MKASLTAVIAAGAVVLISAVAETRTSSPVPPDSLARYEAITSYCEKADPASASVYSSRLAYLTLDLSQDDIQRDRETGKYRQAMEQAHETLSKVSQTTGVKACSEFLAENQ